MARDAQDADVQCTGRHPFPDLIEANKAARAHNKRPGMPAISAYKCAHCGFCHIGKSKPKGKVRLKK